MTAEQFDDDQTRSFEIVTAGTTVSHYSLESKLGEGGMGEVFLARDTQLSRQVALKFLPPNLSEDESFKSRFLREARSAAALNHPNIITIYEIAEYSGRLYIAMEYVSGQPLGSLIETAPFALDSALGIAIQVCEALACAHKAGIIHRDIKADNVMVDDEGRVRLLDFGLARAETDDRLTKVGTAMGSINYMSPEQAQCFDVDSRSDIFSVGTLTYEMLTGILPFQQTTMAGTMYAIINEPAPPLDEQIDLPSRDMQNILNRAMAKDPNDRYQEIEQFLSDLKSLQTGRQISKTTLVASQAEPEAMPSLAILHLRNLGGEEDEFLSYGITEDLIVDLSRSGKIRVPPMRTVLRLKDSNEELAEIAAKLNVDMILDGSIHKVGDSIRVSTQLVEAKTDMTLWANRWEKSIETLAEVKRDLAEGIIRELKIDGSGPEKIETSVSGDPRAYEYYLRGKYAFEKKKDSSDVEVALGLFRQALELDSTIIAARAGMAEALMHQGEHELASEELNEALQEATARNLPSETAMIWCLMARSHISRSQWDEALKLGRESLELTRETGNLVGEAECLGILLDILRRRGQLDEALAMFRRALEVNRKLDDRQRETDVLKNMGTIYLRKGKYTVARELFDEARKLARRRNDASMEADCTGNSGVAHFHTGEYDAALDCYERALEIHTRLGDRSKQALWLNNIAIVYEARGEYRKSLETLEEASEIYNDLGDRGKYGLALGNASWQLAIVGESDRAIALASVAVKISAELDFPLLETSANDTLGLVHTTQGNYEAARQYYRSALEAARKASLEVHISFSQSALGELAFHLGQFDECKKQMMEAGEVAEKIDHQEVKLRTSTYRAAVMNIEGEFDESLSKLRVLADDARQLGDPRYILMTDRLLGQVLFKRESDRDAVEEGRQLLQNALAKAESMEIQYEMHWLKQALSQQN